VKYENAVLQSFAKLFKDSGKPMMLFTVPKLSEYVSKLAEITAQIKSNQSLQSGGSGKQNHQGRIITSI
jgi:hypothetical protein